MAPIVLFGGSFDPVHLGHLIVAERVVEALAAAEVWFVPARAQPLKEGHGASAEHRLAMLAAAVEGNPRFTVEPIELERAGPSYTVDTLRELGPRLTERPYLLMGSDAARELPSWREAEVLDRLATIVVYRRTGEGALATPTGARTVEAPLIEVSATDIRGRVAAGRSIRYLVPEGVRAYIARHGLYL